MDVRLEVPLTCIASWAFYGDDRSVPLTLPPDLDAALTDNGRTTWSELPVETQSALIEFVKDGWLRRTRRRRSRTVAVVCRQGAEAVLAWQAGNARFAQAARSYGATMN